MEKRRLKAISLLGALEKIFIFCITLLQVMVTDFGLSDYEEELRPDSAVCGTATYLAPEVVIEIERFCCV